MHLFGFFLPFPFMIMSGGAHCGIINKYMVCTGRGLHTVGGATVGLFPMHFPGRLEMSVSYCPCKSHILMSLLSLIWKNKMCIMLIVQLADCSVARSVSPAGLLDGNGGGCTNIWLCSSLAGFTESPPYTTARKLPFVSIICLCFSHS